MGDAKDHGIPQFRGTAYDEWQFRVKMHLDALGVVDVLTMAVPTDAIAKESFLKVDKRVKDRLVGFIHNDCLSYVRDKETAKDMWESLQMAFAKKSVVSQLLVRKQLATLRMKDDESVAAHCVVFENLIRQLRSAGATLSDDDVLAQFFLTLPEKFDPLVTALQNISDSQLSFEFAKERILAEETKLADRQQKDDVNKTAFAGKKGFKKRPRFEGKCFKCGKYGHKANDCRQGEARSANEKKKTSHVSFVAYKGAKGKDPKDMKLKFKLDSGSSDHLVNEKWYLKELSKLKNPVFINVAKDNQSLIAGYSGQISGTSDEGVQLLMKDVLYVPELRDNLLSVRKLTKAGIKVEFSENRARIIKDGDTIAWAYLRGNLYEIDITIERVSALMCNADKAKLWHKRFGHIGQQAFNELVKKELTTGLDVKAQEFGFCDICVEAKHSRDPFNGSRQRAKRPLERIHSDVCGQIDPIAWNGARYFVTFIDDFTHFACVYPIKKKSEVFEAMKEYEAMVTAKFGLSISKLSVDQGREYCSKEQLAWYKQKGVQLEATMAYSPQQNGVAERFNRTLVEKVRSMLIESSVPRRLWCEAVYATVYLINRSPTKSLDGPVTPAELWYGVKPDVSKLRVFGCKAYAWVPGQLRKKLDSKSRKTVMVGYVQNGYRLWDVELRKTIIARDVKFDEECFPFKDEDLSEPKGNVYIKLRSHEQEGEDVDGVLAASSESVNVGDASPHTREAPMDEHVGNSDYEDAVDNENDAENTLPPQQSDNSSPEVALRRSERERRPPRKLLDFFSGYRATSAEFISIDTPETYSEIAERSDADKWFEAVKEELQSMEKNNVWSIVQHPKSAKLLKSKWVFAVKMDANGQPSRYKARLVAKGYLQKEGIDYNETYAPVAKLTTIRVVLAVGIHQQLMFHQLDVKTAFLHGSLDEELYMAIPEGVNPDPGKACKLLKSLYGLKQAPRCWNQKFNSHLLSLGFSRSTHDYCLYTKFSGDDILIVVMYVDDLLIAGKTAASINWLKKSLSKNFEMSDCGELKYFLGMKIEKQDEGIALSQTASIDKLLQKFGMMDCNPVRSPMEKGLQLLQKKDNSKFDKPYREMLGSLMYIMLCVRPDLCYAVSYMGRYQQNPSDEHWQHLKRIVRYLKGTSGKKLCFKENTNNPLLGFVDADWASDITDRKSVSGYVFQVYGCTVSWSSKKQTTVALSSSESEYVALSAATAEAVWLHGLLKDLKQMNDQPIEIFEDNRGCIGMANTLESKRAKHIDIKHHFIRDNIEKGLIKLTAISSEKQVADMFTKSLDVNRFNTLCLKLGLQD